MTENLDPLAKRWLSKQKSVISELFERAAAELESAGIRLKAGSSIQISDEISDAQKMSLTPTRLLERREDGVLSLSLLATVKRGPNRYEIVLQVSGTQPCGALGRLSEAGDAMWQRSCFQNGLWVIENGIIAPLRNVQQLTEDHGANLAIVAAFLHSELPNTIMEGVMLLGTIYRCVLDELCGASKMPKLCNALMNSLGGRIPTFPRVIRPSIQ